MGFAISDLQLSCAAFNDGGLIAERYSAYADNISPAFSWSNLPDATQSLALFCHDPDAPLVTPQGHYGYVHWVLYNIPGSVTGIPEGCEDYTAGINNANLIGYRGPRAPQGHGLHRYFFWLMALNTDEKFELGLTLWQLLERVEPNLLGMNRICGTYRKD